MTDEIRHEVVLSNSCSNELESDVPSFVVLGLTEGVIAEMLKAKQAFEAALAFYPSGAHIYGLEVSFYGFEYRNDECASPDEDDDDEAEQEDEESSSFSSDCHALVVDDQGYRLKALIKNSDSEMTSVYLTHAEFEEHLRKFRSLQMAGGIEQAMLGDEAPAPRKSSSPSPL